MARIFFSHLVLLKVMGMTSFLASLLRLFFLSTARLSRLCFQSESSPQGLYPLAGLINKVWGVSGRFVCGATEALSLCSYCLMPGHQAWAKSMPIQRKGCCQHIHSQAPTVSRIEEIAGILMRTTLGKWFSCYGFLWKGQLLFKLHFYKCYLWFEILETYGIFR